MDPRARSATIAVDGRLVTWARETAGLSDAALVKKLGIKDRAKLAAWEAPGARADLTPRQLERLADATKRLTLRLKHLDRVQELVAVA